jgi:uncharacterized membrane protein
MNELIEGLKNLRNGALLTLLSQMLMLLAIVFEVIIGFMFISSYKSLIAFLKSSTVIPLVIVIPFVVSAILGLIGFILFFIATGYLKRYDPDYGIGRLGMIFQLIGVVLMLIIPIGIALATLNVSPHIIIGMLFSMGGLFLLAATLIIIGAILFGIMLMRMDKVDSNFKTAGILYLIGMILNFAIIGVGSIFAIVSLVLIYTTSTRVIESQTIS